ncbi:MAG: antitoxin MazE family protein [Burkholderiales bacterium]|nr:antitoxin MazE family protein [Burkholderiales bacterium]
MTATSERVQQHRQRLRRAGLRPIQLWVPDTRSPGFAEECRRQSARLADDPQERDALEWLQSVADDDGWR